MIDNSYITGIVDELQKSNKRLKNTIDCLTGAISSKEKRLMLYKDFEKDLTDGLSKLEKRHQKLMEIEKNVLSFAPPESCGSNKGDKKQLMTEEHKYLRECTLSYERRILLSRMKLRLYHDRRDLSMLRKNLNAFEGGGFSREEDEKIEHSLKTQIKNLKHYINHEKYRIAREKHPLAREHEAAAIIQAFWRGYITRRNLKTKKTRQNSAREDVKH